MGRALFVTGEQNEFDSVGKALLVGNVDSQQRIDSTNQQRESLSPNETKNLC